MDTTDWRRQDVVDKSHISAYADAVQQVITARELSDALRVTDTAVHRFLAKYGIAHRKTMGRVVLVEAASAIERLPDPYKSRLIAWYDSFLSGQLEDFWS